MPTPAAAPAPPAGPGSRPPRPPAGPRASRFSLAAHFFLHFSHLFCLVPGKVLPSSLESSLFPALFFLLEVFLHPGLSFSRRESPPPPVVWRRRDAVSFLGRSCLLGASCVTATKMIIPAPDPQEGRLESIFFCWALSVESVDGLIYGSLVS